MMQEATKTKAQLIEAVWKKNAIRNSLVTAGKPRTVGGRKMVDNLLHALVPLYFTRAEQLAVTSGDVSRFWAGHGVKVSPQVIAKMWREHVGYTRRTRDGIQITPNGVKYVEAALAR